MKDLCSFMILSRLMIVTINATVEVCSGKQNTYFIFNNFFFDVEYIYGFVMLGGL